MGESWPEKVRSLHIQIRFAAARIFTGNNNFVQLWCSFTRTNSRSLSIVSQKLTKIISSKLVSTPETVKRFRNWPDWVIPTGNFRCPNPLLINTWATWFSVGGGGYFDNSRGGKNRGVKFFSPCGRKNYKIHYKTAHFHKGVKNLGGGGGGKTFSWGGGGIMTGGGGG